MPNSWTSFKGRPILLDVTVSAVAAAGSITSATTGQAASGTSVATVTVNSIAGTAVTRGYVWDALEIEITPPEVNQQTAPDCQIFINNGSDILAGYQYLDGSLQGCMFPRGKLTKGLKRIPLGYSTRDLIRKHADHPVKNLPLLITGLKVTQQLTITVTSTAGWANPMVPLRVVIRGDILSADDVEELAKILDTQAYTGDIDIDVPPTDRYSARHELGGRLDLNNWASLPGGGRQGKTKVNRRIAFAYNNANTPANGPFSFTAFNSLGGQNANVATNWNDLGFDFKETNKAFLLHEVGVNLYQPGTQAYVGWRVDGTVVPQDTQNGTFITSGNNPLAYGAVTPISSSPEFWALNHADELCKLAVNRVGAVPFIMTANGVVIPTNGASFAIGGVLVEKAG